ncbi:unnamed protein product [Macrosiphum euphorbiae]|uniref:Uncharacterized protein n=1 Tax=Macrosiphum euphorbiae TaxID=13131 RepID=A0AAV0VXG2_9HEMI|nr:unnamed protein product [Macrosiphum euphorbiae]
MNNSTRNPGLVLPNTSKRNLPSSSMSPSLTDEKSKVLLHKIVLLYSPQMTPATKKPQPRPHPTRWTLLLRTSFTPFRSGTRSFHLSLLKT